MSIDRRSLMQLIAAAAVSPTAFVGVAQAQSASPESVTVTGDRFPPVETFFRKPSYGSAVLSPNQRYLAALSPAGGRMNIAVVDMEKRSAARITSFAGVDVNTVMWANDNRLVFTTGDQQGLEFRGDGGLFAVDRDGANGRALVEPLAARGAYVLRLTTVMGRIAGSTEEILVMANDRSADTQDVYRMNVTSGRKSLVNESSPGYVLQWVLDGKQQPRATFSMEAKKRRFASYGQAAGSREWRLIAQWDEQLNGVIMPMGFDPQAPNTLYVASNRGRDTMALFSYDMATGQLGEMIYGDDRFDIASFRLIGSPLGDGGGLIFGGEEGNGRLLGLRYNADKPRSVWFDEAAARAQASVDAAIPGAANSFNVNHKRALVLSRSDVEPGRFFIYDQEKRSLEDTGIRRLPQIDSKRMRPMQPVHWMARDGHRIDGYLTLPAQWKKGEAVPMVINPHGGPWAKDNWEFNREVQFLANRGFAVLQPNFRGSPGHGAKHLKLSYRQWGGTMIDDMVDGVEWAIKEGYADPKRIGAYGASYGGYATLMLLVKRPDLFLWGVNYVGVTDMEVHQDTQPAQLYGDFGEMTKILNGDKRADRDMFIATSPTKQIDRIKVPVFHAYGGEDRNVDYANGRVIKDAFERAGKPFEWMFVADEAHGYRQDKNVYEFYTRLEAFIRKHTPGLA